LALPNKPHLDAVKLAAGSGKGILCTKPLGRNAVEAYEMMEAVEKAGVFNVISKIWFIRPKHLSRSMQSDREHSSGDLGPIA